VVHVQVVVVASQKGGVGKTTTTVNLAASLALSGNRVLVVDLEPQAQAGESLGLRIRGDQVKSSLGLALQLAVQGAMPDLRELCFDRSELLDGWDCDGALHVLASEESTMSIAQNLVVAEGYKATPILRRMLQSVAADYDYVVVDTPPAIQGLSTVGWASGDWVMTVCNPEYATVKGAVTLRGSVRFVSERTQGECNPQYLGALLDKSNPPSQWSGQEIEVRNGMNSAGLLPFKTDIRTDTRISSAFGLGTPAVLRYANHAPGKAYAALLGEVLGRMESPIDQWETAPVIDVEQSIA
jgi:chromosome partitioning protein